MARPKLDIMMWLVSYQMQATYKHAEGLRGNATIDMISLIDKHPAKWFADRELQIVELMDAEWNPEGGPQRVDRILRIYGVVEVPGGTLTKEQLEVLEG